MAEIDPTKLYAIFRTLSSEVSKEKKIKQGAAQPPNRQSPSLTFRKGPPRDKDVLMTNLTRRLNEIKSDDNYKNQAPTIAIQEILLWEFGEDFINHPNFKQLTTSITHQVVTNKELKAYLDRFISEV